MSNLLLSIANGWTAPLGPFTILADGVAVDLTGMTVEIVIRRPSGALVTPLGTLTPDPDQVTNRGQVTYFPLATDFTWTTGGQVHQPYRLHFRVTDSLSKVAYFPNGDADEIAVYRA